mgnify:CR=1 FL=1
MTDSDRERGGIAAGRGRVARGVATVRPLLLVALVVVATTLAGCGALPGGGSDGGAQGNVDVPREVTEPLEPSASEVFERVEGILGVNGTAPDVELTSSSTDRNLSNPALRTLVGLPEDPSKLSYSVNTFYDAADNVVYVNEETVHDMNGSEIEAALAYEFGAALHYQQGWVELGWFDSPERIGLYFATLGVVGNAYADEYLEESRFSPPEFEGASAYRWAVSGAQEYYGDRYVDSVIDSPAEVASVYGSDRPTTTEQLLHDTGEEPLALTLDASASNWWTREQLPNGLDRLGEVGTRAVLRSQLPKSEAAAAADGWGNDSVVTYASVRNESVGTVWVHRWDSVSEADEFVDAAEAYADARENDEYAVDVTRPAEDATIVVAHRGEFVANAEIAYEDGVVTVRVGDP